jgi:uncharacterized protein YjbI with pentapeptide repeats
MSESIQPSFVPDDKSNFPDFSSHSYQITRELGQNHQGGRVTYLAKDTGSKQSVVIKQFQFARSGSNWSDYDAYDKEIRVLRQLNHPCIPRYLDSFETPTGFCLVQEYKKASSLAQGRYFSVEEITKIAIEILKVLIYLQEQNPPVIHRDLKPENILVDRANGLKVYLIDFGFARIGGEAMAMSSVVKGTLGFMPPEQLFNRELTLASDLYSLGVTLLCLLTRTRSLEVGKFIDETYQVNFKSLVPNLDPALVYWLESLVAPNPKNRYPDAATALNVLSSLGSQSTPPPIPKTYNKNQRDRLVIGTIVWVSIGLAMVRAIYNASVPNYSAWQTDRALDGDIEQLKSSSSCRQCRLKSYDLQGIELLNADLYDANLLNINLRTANLFGANLERAELINVSLAGANLEASTLSGANFLNSDLTYANLQDTNLQDTRFSKTSLAYANLKKANGFRTNMNAIDLSNAILEGADFRQASLREASLESTNLQGAQLAGVDLTGADLSNADLRGADLFGANLQNANLYGADLRGANLLSADLQGARMPNGKIQF